jgi:hypothetical protein
VRELLQYLSWLSMRMSLEIDRQYVCEREEGREFEWSVVWGSGEACLLILLKITHSWSRVGRFHWSMMFTHANVHREIPRYGWVVLCSWMVLYLDKYLNRYCLINAACSSTVDVFYKISEDTDRYVI